MRVDSKSPCGPPLGGVCLGWGLPFGAVLAPKFSLHPCSSARRLAGLLGPWDLGIVWLPLFALMCFPLLSAPSPGAWLGLRCFGCGWCLWCTISLLCPSRSFPSFFYWVCFLILVACGVAMVSCGVFLLCSPLLDWVSCFSFFLRPLFVSFSDPWTCAYASALTHICSCASSPSLP